MKKLLSAILFLLPTLAMAIDKPIPCSGNSCKLLFETTGSGGAKVSAGNVDGLGKWTIGPAASTDTHTINGGLNSTRKLLVVGAGFYGANTGPGDSCDTECQNSDASFGLNSSSGSCLKAWNSGGVASACATVAASQICLCTGVN